MKKKFNWNDFLKQVMVIAIPVALQQLLTTTGSMVDTMMLSAIGENAVGAVGLCSSFSYLGVSSVYGFIGGGSLFIAQYWGAKDEDNMCRYYGIMLTLCMVIGVLFGLLASLFPSAVMDIYTNKAVVKQNGMEYLRIMGIGYPFMVATLCVSAFLRATERVKIPLFSSIASVFVNIFLNWVLITGRLGFPALGIRGAALATVAANVVNLALCLVLAVCTRFPYLFRFRKMFAYRLLHIRIYFKKCFAILLNEVAMGVSATLINMIYGRQSEAVIAAT
ncbi:MAG: polysaccharide biosynthesis C-terminal domain-containing protein, partial [Lachnospiraceae bacterium]|nr:polysaccharide biosynthesis C-terminal domain-containing protein [Lachnospiraceae bacterium]